MLEVHRSKVFYMRAHTMLVVPTFFQLPLDGVVGLLLAKVCGCGVWGCGCLACGLVLGWLATAA